MSQGDDAKASVNATPEARKHRIAVNLQLEVSGLDLEGRDFVSEARTKMVTRNGASIVINKLLAPEQTVTVKRVGPHPEAEACVVGQIGSETGGNIYGVTLLEPPPDIWGIDFPAAESDQNVLKLVLECPICHTRQLVTLQEIELSVLEANQKLSRRCPKCRDVTLWKKSNCVTLEPETPDATAEPRSTDPEPVPETVQANRRKHSRLKVHMKGCILFGGQETAIEVDDMSRGGVRFSSRREFALGLLVRAAIPYNPGGANIFVSGRICWSNRRPDGTSEYGLKYEKD